MDQQGTNSAEADLRSIAPMTERPVPPRESIEPRTIAFHSP